MGIQKFNRPIVIPNTGDVTLDSNTGTTSIGAGKVTKAKLAVFTANAQTGTGSSQNIAHGLGTTPTFVVCVPTDGGTVSYGTHTGTNVVVTVSSTKKFDVIAFA
ncbi:MAG TPA: hypothetical protein VGN17_26060 [Bryobacteraceae bacterium]|jgi:hypothetical protein